MKIHVDQDGVLADFDTHYENLFGHRPARWPEKESTDWDKVRGVPDFFLTLPKMPGADLLMEAVRRYGEHDILTGCPKEIDVSSNQKIEWAKINVVPTPPVICCRAREKFKHGRPGEVLIDDYLKYRHLWEAMGGIFIHHTSAAGTIRQLGELFG